MGHQLHEHRDDRDPPAVTARDALFVAGCVVAAGVAWALLCVLFLGLPRAAGADDPDRSRRARAALALAGAAKPAAAVAPAPRTPAFPGYAEGYALATARNEVFVAYVGCAGRHAIEPIPGAVVAAAGEVPGYPPQTIVVGYPSGGLMVEHARLDCARFGEVPAAVEAARKKLGAKAASPTPPVAPRPLDWVF